MEGNIVLYKERKYLPTQIEGHVAVRMKRLSESHTTGKNMSRKNLMLGARCKSFMMMTEIQTIEMPI